MKFYLVRPKGGAVGWSPETRIVTTTGEEHTLQEGPYLGGPLVLYSEEEATQLLEKIRAFPAVSDTLMISETALANNSA